MDIKFRNIVTLLVVGGLIGGAGGSIIYDSFENSQILVEKTTAPDGTVIEKFENNSLTNNNIFNIWLGAVLGYGGAIVAVLYKQRTGSGED
jgi:hypothetical protein